jgi:hypothetical protein
VNATAAAIQDHQYVTLPTHYLFGPIPVGGDA